MENKELISKILKASNIIQRKTTHGVGDYIVVSGVVAESLNVIFDEIDNKKKIEDRDKTLDEILNKK